MAANRKVELRNSQARRIQVKILRGEQNLIQLLPRHAIEAATYQSLCHGGFARQQIEVAFRGDHRIPYSLKSLLWLRCPRQRSVNSCSGSF
jgi:hypothetical protein